MTISNYKLDTTYAILVDTDIINNKKNIIYTEAYHILSLHLWYQPYHAKLLNSPLILLHQLFIIMLQHTFRSSYIPDISTIVDRKRITPYNIKKSLGHLSHIYQYQY